MRITTMADTKVPGIGGVNKTTLWVAGVAGVIAAGYAWYKHKKDATAAASAPTASSAYGYAAQGYGYGGYGYGSDLEAYEQGLTAGAEYGYGGYAYDASGVGTSSPVTTTTPVAATNAQWAQYAEQFLVNQGGYNASTVASALGEYITGANVGSNEGIVQAAIAFEGYPPVAGTNGYPPSINTNGDNGGQTSGNPVTGGPVSPVAGSISNLASSAVTTTSFKATWNSVTGATGGYKWNVTGGGVNKSGTTKSTSTTVTGLKKGTTYNFGIQALPGGAGDNMHVTTKSLAKPARTSQLTRKVRAYAEKHS
jgi:hypothetical protein